MIEKMNVFAAASTYVKIGAVLTGILSAAHAAGLFTEVTPEMVTQTTEQAAVVAKEASNLWEGLIGIATALGLLGVADAQRAVGKKDLVIGDQVISRAGNT
ncbi:MAG: hypothetical protein AAFR79_11675 [Pseudomonadota bacterium]